MKATSILITGAGTGIGKDSAFALARLGYRVLAGTHTTVQEFNEEMAATKYRWLKPNSFFKDDVSKMKVHDATITASSHPTDSVVKAIVHAVCARRPKIRYTVPVRYAVLVFLAKFLPDRLKDSVMRKFAGL